MAPTPSAKSNQTHFGNPKTPQSKHRLNFNLARPSPNPAAKEAPPAEHPVEVVGRIRDYPDRKEKPQAALKLNADRQSLRVKTDIGYRDFHLDGVSFSEEEDIDLFYKKFVEARINGVKLGAKCTIMMYGPTGAGKSHTMFGSSKQPGIVYRSLKEILGEGDEVSENSGVGTFVQVTVLEIYNEEIYDLLSTNTGGGFGFGWSKGNASKVRLEIMGKRAKNATFISGNDAGSLSKEIQKVEKRRIVKSTLSNDRSSRSHCLIILDVPTVGGRLMLVDMAGSENIEQAGQNGFEAKMQTAKINQGNIALKRVVESIANGDSHVPFRDSKLTMLLQDSFEDDKSKILMILCASPDPKELYKTISTLEYGAKAKCIVRGPSTPIKDKGGDDSSSADVLGSRIAAMDQFIYKLQVENKLREKEKNEAQKELRRKEEEISALRAKLVAAEGKGLKSKEEEVNIKVKEQTMVMKSELEKKIQECQQMANKFVEMERRKMEERMLQQQQEVDLLRRRLEEIELDLHRSKGSADLGGETSFAERILEIYSDDSDMVKSMDLSKSYDMETIKRDAAGVYRTENSSSSMDTIFGYNSISNPSGGEEDVVTDVPTFTTNKVSLSTVFEEEEEEEDGEDHNNKCSTDEEVQKEVVEEKTICSSAVVGMPADMLSQIGNLLVEKSSANEEDAEGASYRERRIQNIFTLCGNYREMSQNMRETPMLDSGYLSSSPPPAKTIQEHSATKSVSNEHKSAEKNTNLFEAKDLKENFNPSDENSRDLEVYVKWTPSKDSSGAPGPKEQQEARTSASKLPTCNNNQLHGGHLNQLPLGQVQNLLPVDGF
ncbi:PREDICTED: kinesin-like protein KIN-10A [Ipomoea nil]|uniref:kinesin-like protein KIN-10A n=1 Tax=Ipomoea nil TaxID=35883 RepID=UPI000901FA9F|nr:PREDICTED: kinesin-like protein KIN-10A [Ipomoea nil]